MGKIDSRKSKMNTPLNKDIRFEGTITADPKKPNTMILDGKKVKVALFAFDTGTIIHTGYIGKDRTTAIGLYLKCYELRSIFSELRSYIERCLGGI